MDFLALAIAASLAKHAARGGVNEFVITFNVYPAFEDMPMQVWIEDVSVS